jgi:hypothetical protein
MVAHIANNAFPPRPHLARSPDLVRQCSASFHRTTQQRWPSHFGQSHQDGSGNDQDRDCGLPDRNGFIGPQQRNIVRPRRLEWNAFRVAPRRLWRGRCRHGLAAQRGIPTQHQLDANLTASAGSYFIPTAQDAFFIRNEYGNITVDKISVVNSTSVAPSSTSPATPTATAGILDDLGNLFDDIVDAATELVETVVETAIVASFAAIPIIIIELADNALDIVEDVVQLVRDVVDVVQEGIEEILDNLPSIPLPIVSPPDHFQPRLDHQCDWPATHRQWWTGVWSFGN